MIEDARIFITWSGTVWGRHDVVLLDIGNKCFSGKVQEHEVQESNTQVPYLKIGVFPILF